ncbi:unnamed protein product [Citrullus colocynthis]|uniref:Protein kinase domain-containing protein n=1 Tax=Citrullus colocynthis TaxID=252529 RepID=A0ABP0Y1B4_9ROSI
MRATPTTYWESKTTGSGFQLVFNLSGSIYISAPNGSVVKTLTSNTPSTEDFYHRAVFEYDGVFRQYVYPKTKITGPWAKGWSQVSVSVPSNMCLPIVNGLGSGACGYNSYCSVGDDQRPTCHCPQGYDMLDPNDAFQGCKPTFIPQSCDEEETDAFEFFSIENSDWPDADYEAFNGRTRLLIEESLPVPQGMNLRIFSYEELNKATSGFTQQLGTGAFATVYKGVVNDDCTDKDNINNMIAVKKLENMVKEGDQEFKAEVSAIAGTNHKNLVQLLGSCNQEPHRMLVYEYMHKGSLADYLFGCSEPNWYQRIEVVLGTARGLWYLHEGCETQIIHCDIKPQKILLDDSLVAKISDFGLANLVKKNQTRTMTGIRGTKGYVAPEWFRNLAITTKVDVYSFGIVLLEIIRVWKEREKMSLWCWQIWAYDCFQERRVETLVQNDEEAKQDMKRVEKFVKIAIWCIQEEPSFRPSMNKVVQMLEGAVEVSTPPQPSSFITAIH